MSKWWGRTLNTIYLASVMRNSRDGLIHTVQPEKPKRPGGKRKAYRRKETDDRIPPEACMECETKECNGGKNCFKVLSYRDCMRFKGRLKEMMCEGMTIREVMNETGLSRYMVTHLLKDGYYPWLIEDQEKIRKYMEENENA